MARQSQLPLSPAKNCTRLISRIGSCVVNRYWSVEYDRKMLLPVLSSAPE